MPLSPGEGKGRECPFRLERARRRPDPPGELLSGRSHLKWGVLLYISGGISPWTSLLLAGVVGMTGSALAPCALRGLSAAQLARTGLHSAEEACDGHPGPEPRLHHCLQPVAGLPLHLLPPASAADARQPYPVRLPQPFVQRSQSQVYPSGWTGTA